MVDQRFVLSARIVGGVYRDTPKLKMFMITVQWSDGAELIIYRSFKDFKKFHKELKKRFPHLNPFRRNDRTLPKFRGKAMMSSLPQTGAKKSVKKMKFLENYCIKLLKCDANVTQSPELVRFFIPKDHDLEPDFTKNSIMILLSDLSPDGTGGEQATLEHAGSVTHPFVTQTYRCVAPYETKDTKNKPFKAAKDEKLDVLIKNPTGWWLVENEEKRLAWFPAPYLELWEGEDDDDSINNNNEFHTYGGCLYCAVRSFSTTKTDEVSVSIGSVVEVLRKSDNGWWLVRLNNKAGYVPSMHLQPYNNPRVGLHSLTTKLHSSTLNLASSRDSASPYPSAGEGSGSELDYEGSSRREAPAPGRLIKARSLDILSESWPERERERERMRERESESDDGDLDSGPRRMSNTSAETSFSDFSSSSNESLGLQEELPRPQPRPRQRRDTPTSDDGASSRASSRASSGGSDGPEEPAEAPKVPPRPQTKEILNRCTTMTRKAALATKTRLECEVDPSHRR